MLRANNIVPRDLEPLEPQGHAFVTPPTSKTSSGKGEEHFEVKKEVESESESDDDSEDSLNMREIFLRLLVLCFSVFFFSCRKTTDKFLSLIFFLLRLRLRG